MPSTKLIIVPCFKDWANVDIVKEFQRKITLTVNPVSDIVNHINLTALKVSTKIREGQAFSLAEIKWTDKFYEDPSQLKSLRKFLEVNDGIRKIIVTTKSKLGSATIDGNTFLFIPSALYAYWVSKYLFEDKTNQILLSKDNV